MYLFQCTSRIDTKQALHLFIDSMNRLFIKRRTLETAEKQNIVIQFDRHTKKGKINLSEDKEDINNFYINKTKIRMTFIQG